MDNPQTKEKGPRKRETPEPLTYTLQSAAAASGLSVATLRRREKEGLLHFHHVGGRTLVPVASLRVMLGLAA